MPLFTFKTIASSQLPFIHEKNTLKLLYFIHKNCLSIQIYIEKR